jgi:hypothetical protein
MALMIKTEIMAVSESCGGLFEVTRQVMSSTQLCEEFRKKLIFCHKFKIGKS